MATKQTVAAASATRDSFFKRLGARSALAFEKKSDFIVGWESIDDPRVKKAIADYNSRAVAEYAELVLKDLSL